MSAVNEKGSQSENDRGGLKSENSENEEDFAIIPPNGGWGWVVVFSAFYCNVVVDGIQLTFGIFLKSIAEEFHASHSEVALAGSLMFGVHLLMGPVCSGCSAVFGLRPVTIAGCLICCFGVAISYFATDNYFLYFSYGLVGGMGLGLVYMNTLMITSLYFTTYMPLAIGIVVCGTGVGTMVFAVLGYNLLRVTTWRNSILMQAALAGSMAFAAATFKPLKPVKVKISVQRRDDSFDTQSSQTENPTTSRRPSLYVKDFRGNASLSGRDEAVKEFWSEILEEKLLEEVSMKNKHHCCKCCRRCPILRRKKKKKEKVLVLVEVVEGARRSSFIPKNVPETLDSERSSISLEIIRNASSVELYKRLSLDKEKPKMKTLTLLKKSITTMLDYHLLRSLAFDIFTICGAVQISTLLIVHMYEEERCKELGFSEKMSVYFLITLGGCNTFWRIFLGALAIFPKASRILSISGIFIGGLAIICSGFSSSTYYQFGFCFFFGLGMASVAVFRIILLIQLVGWELASNATGINLMFMGIFCIIAPPLLGWAKEAMHNYDVIFCTSGTLFLISGLVQIGVSKIREKELKKKQTVENDT